MRGGVALKQVILAEATADVGAQIAGLLNQAFSGNQ